MIDILNVIANIFGALQTIHTISALTPYRVIRSERATNVKCVVVTVGDERVFNSVREVIEQLDRLKLDYIILSSNPLPFKNVIVVPRSEDGNKYRAIKYLVKNFVRDDYWYVFFDDDSYPLDDGFLYDITYFSKIDRKFVVGNGILRPRPGRSKLAYALDWIRYFDDLTRFKFAALIKRPVYGLHGELLIVRGDVLREIWPSMEESITEDFNFAMHILKRRYKFFQSRTIVSIKSPNSIRDFIRQRARWANVFYDTLRHKNLLVVIYFVTGVIVSPLFAPLWFLYHSIFAMIASVYYWIAYIYGGMRAKLKYTPLVLFFSAIEMLGMLKGVFKRAKEFAVIDKS